MNKEMINYFVAKCEELGLKLEYAKTEYKQFLEKFPESKITKANITKFLKSLTVNEESIDTKKAPNHDTKTFIGLDPISGIMLYI